MPATIALPQLAALLATPARARMLEALHHGKPMSATELAIVAEVQPQTASSHLARLSEAGVLVCEQQGRHRFYRIASARIADLLETFAELDPEREVRNYRAHPRLAQARTCYDHLAGWLGTSITSAMLARDQLRENGKDFELQPAGEQFLRQLGVDVDGARRQRRLFARCCLDWTERRQHLGGSLGAALAHRCFDQHWVRQRDGERLVQLTAAGERAFAEHFGISPQR